MLNFMTIRYDEDIKEAAMKAAECDESSAERISEFHGEDPRVIMIDIHEERGMRELRRHWG